MTSELTEINNHQDEHIFLNQISVLKTIHSQIRFIFSMVGIFKLYYQCQCNIPQNMLKSNLLMAIYNT